MFSLFFSVTQYNIYISPVAPFTLFTFCLMPQSLIKSHACLKSHAHVMWYSNFPWFAECWILRNWSEKWMSWAGTLERYWYMYSISFKAIPLRCLCYLYDGVCFAFASMQYFALLMSLIFYFILVLCRVIASPSCLHHSLMFVLFCFALLCLPISSSSSFCILSGLPVPGAFCVFSCACPSPSRSEHWGAHSDPSGGETSEDQSPAQAGGGQRYGSGLNRMCLGKVLCGVFLFT